MTIFILTVSTNTDGQDMAIGLIVLAAILFGAWNAIQK